MNHQPVAVALAILYREGKFLLQLRDNFPHILYPDRWGLFGGHLEAGETPEEGLKRELIEEINYLVPQPKKFRCYNDDRAIRHLYHGPLTVPIHHLILGEGADLALATPEDIQRGNCYSPKLNDFRPLGIPHQKMLLDFIQSGININID